MTDLDRFTELMDDLGLKYATKSVQVMGESYCTEIGIKHSMMLIVFVFDGDGSFVYMSVER